jgi:hypothetical protein
MKAFTSNGEGQGHGRNAPTREPESHKTPAKPVENSEAKKETEDDDTIPEFGAEKKPEEVADPAAMTGKETAPQLRAAYKQTTAELKQARASEATLKARIAELEKTSTAPSKKETELAAKVEELETQIRYHDYTKSSEFRDKYQAPIASAKEALVNDLQGLKVTGQDGVERDATLQDVAALLDLPAGQAAQKANELFGAAAPEILAHRRTLKGLFDGQEKAINEWRTKGAERETQMKTEQAAELKEAVGRFQSVIDEARAHKSGLFAKPPDDDADGVAKFTEGEKLVRTAFSMEGGETIPEGLTPKQARAWQATKLGNVAAQAAAFPMVRLKLSRAQKEIASLKAKLAELSGSEPVNGGKRGGDSDQAADSTVEGRLKAYMADQNRRV